MGMGVGGLMEAYAPCRPAQDDERREARNQGSISIGSEEPLCLPYSQKHPHPPLCFRAMGAAWCGAVSADVSFRSGAGRSSRIPGLLSACSLGFGLTCQKTVESYGTVTSFFREHGVGFLKNAGCFSITDPPGSEPSPGFFTSALFRGPMRTSYKGEGGAGRADGWGGRGALFSERFPLPPQISLTPTPQPARRKQAPETVRCPRRWKG